MKLIVTEKNDAAKQIAGLLGSKKPTADKVYTTPVYRFNALGDECVAIGLRGHILQVDFVPEITYTQRSGWQGIGTTKKIPAPVPDSLPKPPFKKKKPFMVDGVDLKGWKMDALPYLIYAPIEKLPKEKDIIRALKNLAGKADSIVIATDFDREGELIGADAVKMVREVNTTAPISRARYSAFTKDEIVSAFNNLTVLDENLAAAGASRRDIDLVWGAVLTRYLTLVKFAGYGNVRSSGRVQTPTLALICARERERLAFVSEDYWIIKGSFDEGPDIFEAKHKTEKFFNQNDAQAALDAVAGESIATVTSVESKQRKVAPPAPFNTTSLQMAASAEGISPARAMRIAESLYMKGLISYPRVDNTVYPKSLNLAEVVGMLGANPAYRETCSKILSAPTIHATRGKTEDTDHPPIYPTGIATSDTLTGADWKIYNLVARRFLATLMDSAVMESTKAVLQVGGETFIAKGDVTVVPGFKAIYQYGKKKDEELPVLREGEQIAFNGATCTQKQTEPPARYSQAKLIKEMEELGLGTKSTRASIIERLYTVKYIQNDPIEPSQLGMAVIDALDRFAPHITHSEMTSELENEMLAIGKGTTTYEAVVADSRDKLSGELTALLPVVEEVKAALGEAVAADAYVGKCPSCGHDLQIRQSSKTKRSFIGCSGWPECEITFPIPQGKVESLETVCDVCGLPKIKVTPFRQKAREICINPDCASNQTEDIFVGVCPVCADAGVTAKMYAKTNPKTLKRYIRCENYETCENGYPLPPTGEIIAMDRSCDACGAPMVTIQTKRGPWVICPNFNCPAREDSTKTKKSSSRKSSSRKSTGRSSSKSKK